ncbi:MAG: patatin-like phospholipase family protein [bacterium]
MRIFLCLLLFGAPFCGVSAEPLKVGLVLSGGGTKGGAHIGVIRALEEHNVKVSYVVGTSVGAIIGAMYATGLTADEIEAAISTIDWDDVLRDEPARGTVPIEMKRDDFDFLVQARMGFSGGQLKLPLGVTQGQKVTQLLRRLLQRSEGVIDFDQLEIPFRAVATSLTTGEAVTLAQGDLALSVRASMSLPGIFAPVELEGHYLVDGGIAANLPVDVARQMGADRVIAVDITSPLLPRQDIDSVLSVTQQIVNMITRRNADEQIATLAPTDIVIRPDVQEIDTLDFANVLDAMEPGYVASQSVADELHILAASTGPDQRETLSASTAPAERTMIEFVEVTDDSGLSADVVQARLGIDVPERYDRRTLDRRIARLYGSGLYQSIDYALVERDGSTGLAIEARAKAWGPDYLQFGLQLEEDFSSDADFNIGAAYLKTGLNDLGAQWRTRLNLGAQQGISSQWSQPWTNDGRLFSRFEASYERNNIRLYIDDDDPVGELRVQEAGGMISIGRQLGNASEVEVAWHRLWGSANEFVGEVDIPNEKFDIGEFSFTYRHDTLNRTNRPSDGSLIRMTALESGGVTGGENYQQIHAAAMKAFKIGRGQFAVSTIIGATVEDDAPIQSYFTLGGLGRLSGYPVERFRGQHIGFLRLNGSRDLTRARLPLFFGASVEVGNTWSTDFNEGPESWITAGSVYAGLNSPIGPVYLATGIAEGGQKSIYLSLGNPFSSRAYRQFD